MQIHTVSFINSVLTYYNHGEQQSLIKVKMCTTVQHFSPWHCVGGTPTNGIHFNLYTIMMVADVLAPKLIGCHGNNCNCNWHHVTCAINVYLPGVLATEGLVWKEHRRFLTNAFRELGVGRQKYEPNIHEEMEFFLEVGSYLLIPYLLFWRL